MGAATFNVQYRFEVYPYIKVNEDGEVVISVDLMENSHDQALATTEITLKDLLKNWVEYNTVPSNPPQLRTAEIHEAEYIVEGLEDTAKKFEKAVRKIIRRYAKS